MTEATLLPFDLPAVQRKKLTVDFDGGSQSSDGGLLLLREAERSVGICTRLAGSLTDRRDPSRIEHSLVEMIKTRALAICCGYEDGNDLDRLRGDPLLKLAVGRCPESGADLCSQSTMSRLENMPSRRQAVRMTAALIDQFCASFPAPPAEITLDIDDTLDIVHGGQQLSFWNGHHEERCFMPIHVYHVESGKPVVVILRTGKTPAGREVRCVIKHITRRIRRHWPATRVIWRGDSHYGRVEAMAWCEDNGCDYIFGFQGNSGLDARVVDDAETVLLRHAASEHDKVRASVDFEHRPKSWQKARRFVARIEVSFQETKSGHLAQATDIRYCVTSLKGDADLRSRAAPLPAHPDRRSVRHRRGRRVAPLRTRQDGVATSVNPQAGAWHIYQRTGGQPRSVDVMAGRGSSGAWSLLRPSPPALRGAARGPPRLITGTRANAVATATVPPPPSSCIWPAKRSTRPWRGPPCARR
jgi:hypothetical protein